MEVVVAQTALRQTIQRRRVDRTAKRCRRTKAHIVNQNDDDVGRTLGRFYLEKRGCLDVTHIELFVFGWVRFCKWQMRSVYLVGLHADRCDQKGSRQCQAAGFCCDIDAHIPVPWVTSGSSYKNLSQAR